MMTSLKLIRTRFKTCFGDKKDIARKKTVYTIFRIVHPKCHYSCQNSKKKNRYSFQFDVFHLRLKYYYIINTNELGHSPFPLFGSELMSVHFVDSGSNCLLIYIFLFSHRILCYVCDILLIQSGTDGRFLSIKSSNIKNSLRLFHFDCNKTCLFSFCNSINHTHSKNRFIVALYFYHHINVIISQCPNLITLIWK